MRYILAGIMVLVCLILLNNEAEARSRNRCGLSSYYRPSMGICVSKAKYPTYYRRRARLRFHSEIKSRKLHIEKRIEKQSEPPIPVPKPIMRKDEARLQNATFDERWNAIYGKDKLK